MLFKKNTSPGRTKLNLLIFLFFIIPFFVHSEQNLTGTDSAYYPNKNKNVNEKKYKSWKN